MTTNDDLRRTYDAQYAAGYAAQHTPVDTWEESLLLFELGAPWQGQQVLEIGCGEGRLAAHIMSHGAAVTAIDYSPAAIHAARQYCLGVNFRCGTLADLPRCRYDRIVLQGVLEHMDDPWERLTEYVRDWLNPAGRIVTSSPSFLNPRGYVWQTLRLLFDMPMSLTDLHTINPWDMQAWADDNGCDLYYAACHRDWAAGKLMLEDYRRRLPKALADAGLSTHGVEELLAWLEQAASYFRGDWWHCGATMGYRISRKPV